jgi:asparagine synthase (glutamine-hydrolysing)
MKGKQILPALNGDFAFAVWDDNTQKLSLVRDRAGVKPLYYSITGEGIIFGSELKVFLQSGLRYDENTEALRSFFVFKYYPANETPLTNVFRVPPGCVLTYDAIQRTLECSRYWSIPAVVTSSDLKYDDLTNNLREMISEAVRLRLIGDVPVGNFLSGGVDSSGIAFYMRDRKDMLHHCARKSIQDLKVEGTSSDADSASRLAKDLGLHLTFYDIGYSDDIEALIRMTVQYGDDTIADGSQIPSFLIAREAAQHSTVLLSGMGADELFLGYGGHILTLLSLYLDKLPRWFSGMITDMLGDLHPGKGHFKGQKRFLKKLGLYNDYPSSKYALFSIVGDYERSKAIVREGVDPMTFISGYFLEDNDPFASLSRFEYENVLVKNLSYLDRMCMANSVEGRVPYLDPSIIDFALSLPREYKLSNFGRSKRILKDALRPVLPGYILNRRKAGFGMPLRSMFMNEETTRKLVKPDYFASRPEFNRPHIESLIVEHIDGANDNSSLLYALTTYRLWRKEFFGDD